MAPDRRPYEKFLKFPETPVRLLPFDPQSLVLAEAYKESLDRLLAPHQTEAELFGSTALRISGKGELEFAVYLDDARWQAVSSALVARYGAPVAEKPDRIRFMDAFKGLEVEIVMKRGEDARLGKLVMEHFLAHSDELARYEQLKHRYAHSEREYHFRKAEYLSDLQDILSER